jgi:hypothetical protein
MSTCSSDLDVVPVPPFLSSAACAWPIADNSSTTLADCCGGFPLLTYDNGCYIYCDAGRSYFAVEECARDFNVSTAVFGSGGGAASGATSQVHGVGWGGKLMCAMVLVTVVSGFAEFVV